MAPKSKPAMAMLAQRFLTNGNVASEFDVIGASALMTALRLAIPASH
jgi:hypothetical protein